MLCLAENIVELLSFREFLPGNSLNNSALDFIVFTNFRKLSAHKKRGRESIEWITVFQAARKTTFQDILNTKSHKSIPRQTEVGSTETSSGETEETEEDTIEEEVEKRRKKNRKSANLCA